MEFTVIVVALIGYLAFRQWMQHHRRIMVHRERAAAIAKGIDLPPLEQEVKRSTWNVQRLLLLAGWTWVALGIGVFIVLSILLSFPANDVTKEIPLGMQYIGVIPFGIGVAHLVTYLVGARRERQSL
jgi:hypothetical protein